MTYTYWQDSDFFVGYWDQYPDYWTQGKTLKELEANLKDLNTDLKFHIPQVRQSREMTFA
jgi:predicted RNase H-like HicB family nuclease